jgi:hypothetical protein
MFATKLKGPRIKAYFINPSHGLFLTCRGEKYIQHNTILYNVWQLICGLPNAKNLTRHGGIWCKGQTSLHSSPMLWFNCPISHKRLSQPHSLITSSTPHICTHMIQIQTDRAEDDIGTLESFWSGPGQTLPETGSLITFYNDDCRLSF